jgi:hypothetical protein
MPEMVAMILPFEKPDWLGFLLERGAGGNMVASCSLFVVRALR